MAVVIEHPKANVRKLFAGEVATKVGLPVADLVEISTNDVNRFGQDVMTSLAGPTFGLVTDVTKATLGNVQKAIKGEDTEAGKNLVDLGRRYTPAASSLFYARAAWNRVFMDQLQFVADPEAHRRFRDMERKLQRDYDQGYWWRPGDLGPARAPDPAGLVPELLR